MRNCIRTTLFSSILLSSMLLLGIPANAQISVGIRIGAPPEPYVVAVVPAQPGPEFVWIGGYWYPGGGHYRWHEGYLSPPPYGGACWIGPRHGGGRFYNGYLEGSHGRFGHSHKWDHEHEIHPGRYNSPGNPYQRQ